jgi:dipeptidyl aminopeptidase
MMGTLMLSIETDIIISPTSPRSMRRHQRTSPADNGRWSAALQGLTRPQTLCISLFGKSDNSYFISTKKSPVERHLYSIHLTGKDMTALTDTTTDGYYSVSFSPLAQYYLLNYGGPGLPYSSVLSTTDRTFNLLLEGNSPLNETLQRFDLPQRVYGTIKVNGFTLNYREIRPPNFDSSGNTKYPVLFHCYGGPGSQTVDKRFSVDWHSWLASEPRLEYLIVEVDGRGTGYMGRKSRVGVRGQLGTLESYDQAAAARYASQCATNIAYGNLKIT